MILGIIYLTAASPATSRSKYINEYGGSDWPAIEKETSSKNIYQGFIYPDRRNMIDDITIGVFHELQQCREVAIEIIARSGWTKADYECGKNCRGKTKPFICEETPR